MGKPTLWNGKKRRHSSEKLALLVLGGPNWAKINSCGEGRSDGVMLPEEANLRELIVGKAPNLSSAKRAKVFFAESDKSQLKTM